MKNKLFLMITVIMACSLCACGQQKTGTMTNTEKSSTEQVVAGEDNSEMATAEVNNREQTETKKQNNAHVR